MGANNNFKKLMDEEEAFFIPPPHIEKKIEGSISFLDFFGRMTELFIPRILELFVVMLGGTVQQLKEAEMPPFLTETGESNRDDDDTPGGADIEGTPPENPTL